MMTTHHSIFEQLKSLKGDWRGKRPNGKTLAVRYAIHANASVIMEHWLLNETTDALTLYHMDDDILMATHYCPLCNQPRLNLKSFENATLEFECVSVTNLKHPNACRQHSFQIRFLGFHQFWRNEIYVGQGGFAEAVTFERISPTAPNP